MNCEETEELIGAYALGALTRDETSEVDMHLASCTKHEDVPELRAVAQSLMLAAPDVDPPPTLKARLMDAVHRDLQRPTERPRSEGVVGWLKSFFSQRPAYALVGALSAAGVAIIAFALLLPSGDGSTDPVVAHFTTSPVGATGTLVYEAEGRDLTITAEDLPTLSSDKVYQIWAVRDDSPRSLGFLKVIDEDRAFADLTDTDLAGADVVAITVEPAGGSPKPTTNPVLEARL